MTAPQSWLLTACGCFALVSVGILALQGREAIVSAERSGGGGILAKTNTTLDDLNSTLDYVNRPCGAKDAHGLLLAPGVLCDTGKTVTRIGDIAVTSQAQVLQSGQLIAAATANMNAVGAHIATVADNLSLTAKAATGAVTQATMDLQTANTTIASAQPLLGHLDDVTVAAHKSVADFNVLLEDPTIPVTMKNVSAITTSGANIFATTDAVEKKLAACTLHPHFTCNLKGDIIFGAQVGGYILSGLH